ncbi:unnamed protein product [Linum tenue]|uniref:Uncharacterized protein n=1 Tax=Linum tenue TaxID=586396 RepID=A0AAV0PVU6_9ROSI|nr:unnamed protein product [Linum tenue]
MAAKICCPIEMEPKTLSEGQLNHARELAADVVLNLEPEEVSTIFTKKATTLVSPNIAAAGGTVDGQMRKKDEAVAAADDGAVAACQCCCIDPTNSFGGGLSLDELKLKEPLTAPF